MGSKEVTVIVNWDQKQQSKKLQNAKAVNESEEATP